MGLQDDWPGMRFVQQGLICVDLRAERLGSH
jgi:hypothetical protein